MTLWGRFKNFAKFIDKYVSTIRNNNVTFPTNKRIVTFEQLNKEKKPDDDCVNKMCRVYYPNPNPNLTPPPCPAPNRVQGP